MIKAQVQDIDGWIRNSKTGEPIPPSDHPGYYPGYSTMSQRKYWDAKTRQVVEDRVYNVPPIRFFDDVERLTMFAVADRVIPQDDRTPELRIPVVNYVDARLAENRIDGYRFEDMPPDGEAYHLGLKAIEETAYALYSRPFVDLGAQQQDFILKSIHDGEKLGAHGVWEHMPIERFWHLLVQDCVAAYYAHPWAWDEIGYGGPAYPRAYTRLEGGEPEPWEVDEKRYEWAAPPNSLSDVYELPQERQSVSGQSGTH